MNEHWSNQAIVHRFGWFVRAWQSETSTSELQTHGSKLDQALANTANAFKHDRTTTVMRINLATKDIVLKRYNARTLGHAFSRMLRKTRARRCWNMSYAFDDAGLNVATPVLMMEKRFGPLRFNAYFASELLAGEELLSALPRMVDVEKKLVVEAVYGAFAKMQKAKITHGDLKASNLIWGQGKLYFIDLDAAQKHRSLVTWNVGHKKDRRRFRKNWQGNPDLMALFSNLA
jgi:tRNA A-37 threonylcarbamoyl transferase component Bud32